MFVLLMTKTTTMVVAMVTMTQRLINKFQSAMLNHTNTPEFGDTHKAEPCSAGGTNQTLIIILWADQKHATNGDWRKHVSRCGATVAESETKTESETQDPQIKQPHT